MNQLRNIQFINISFLLITPITPIIPTLSFRVNKNQFYFTYEYVHAFSKNEHNFLNTNNYTFWKDNEILFQNNDFQIKFDSQNQPGIFYIDLYSYKVNKWYLIKINYNHPINFSFLDKNKINNDISSIIIFNWLDDVSGKIKINSNIALNDKKSIILKDGLVKFQSSWGVWNRANSTVKTLYKLSKLDIMESLKIDWWDDSIDIEKAVLTKLQYLPLVEILDPPVGYAKWKQNSISINNKLIDNHLNNQVLNILLPSDSDSGQEWWKWFTNGSNNTQWLEVIIDLTSSAIGTLIAGVLNCSTPGIGFGIGFATGMFINQYIRGFINKINFDYQKNKILCDNYYDLIMSKGYSMDFNPIILNLNNNVNKIKVNSIVEYGSKATAIFGDGTQVKIFSNPAVASIECDLRKYVEK